MHEVEPEGEHETREGGHDPGGVSRLTPWAISLGLHAGLALMLFSVVWSVLGPEEPQRPRVVVSFDDPGLAQPLEDQSEEPARPIEVPAPSPPEREAEFQPSLSDQIALLEPRSGAILAPAPPSETMREMISQRRAPRVEFAGLGASSARDVVYVVDASGSMLPQFPWVLGELERSLRRLEPSQWFQVIVFGPGLGGYEWAQAPGHDPRATELLPATSRNIQSAIEWARRVLPSGRSNPTTALRMALGLEPDAVFVLSSSITGLGVWEPNREDLLGQIDQLNPADSRTGRRPVVIKTIQVLEPDPAGILEAIGRAHGGEDGYNFISREELQSR